MREWNNNVTMDEIKRCRGSLMTEYSILMLQYHVEINPKLRLIEITKLLENYARNTQKEIESVE